MINILSSTNTSVTSAHVEWLGRFLLHSDEIVTVEQDGELFFVTNPNNQTTFMLASATHGSMTKKGWAPKGSAIRVSEASKSIHYSSKKATVKDILDLFSESSSKGE